MFEKTKKAEGNLTAIDLAEVRLEKIIEEKKKANEKNRLEIIRLAEEKKKLKKQHDELDVQVRTMTAEYSKILAEAKTSEIAIVEEESITREDLKTGKVTVGEFLAVGKERDAIVREAGIRAEEKLAKVRDAIRELRVRTYDLRKGMAEVDENIARNVCYNGQILFYEIDALKKELELAGVHSVGISSAHLRKQEAENDLAMTKGSPLFHAKNWQIKSVEEAELLFLDPVIQAKHFDKFGKFLDEIRKLDFAEMAVCYVPCDFAGRSAGDFWYHYRPKTLPKRGKA